MKRLKILPLNNAAAAKLVIPGSKSYTNRALLIAAMTYHPVRIINPLASDDTEAMVGCLKKLGIEIKANPDDIEVIGDIRDVADSDYDLDVDISGTTMRFMLALASVIPGRQTLGGKEGLNKRPIGEMVKALEELGAKIQYLDKKGCPPVCVESSALSGGTIKMNGTESSQYLSAVLMIAPLIGYVRVEVIGELISKPYIDMTIDVIKKFGGKLLNKDYKSFAVAGVQTYKASQYVVEGDVSSASYFLAIAALTASTFTLKNINPKSFQADMGFLKILEDMGNSLTNGENEITIEGKGVRSVSVNMQDCPDQAQTLAVLAAFANGITTIKGIQSLRIKETERIKAIEQELQKMGIQTSSTPDTLVIQGGNPKAASIATYGDHRMAMSFAVAGSKLSGMVIEDPDVVAKTFPDFWKKLAEIGVSTELIKTNLVLIGMRGSGKTTAAELLAKKLSLKPLDLDQTMVNKLGLSTPEIVDKHGWDYFRNQESIIAHELSKTENTVISTGGGVVLKSENVKALKEIGTLVWLRAPANVLMSRIGDPADRPPLTSAKTLSAEVEQVLNERQILYETAADVIIDTENLTPEQVADKIVGTLKRNVV